MQNVLRLMKTISLPACGLALSSLCGLLLFFIFYSPALDWADSSGNTHAALAPPNWQLRFNNSIPLGSGEQSSVAVVRSSGLILNFYKNDGVDNRISYRIGKPSTGSVAWGPSILTSATGGWPNVAVTNDGYVIAVYGSTPKSTEYHYSNLYYQVGWIDPNGGENQTISWKTGITHWDAGFLSSIAINDHGVIVCVYEAATSGLALYYRVGHLRNSAGGDYTIEWDSGPRGIQYETGKNPSIAINNRNQVLEAHQVYLETLLHYRRGTVSGGKITFGDSRRYDNHAVFPSVALLDDGTVLEGHQLGGLISRTGSLSLSNWMDVQWNPAYKLDPNNNIVCVRIATNETFAIQTHQIFDNGTRKTFIYYSLAPLWQRYDDGTLVKGSSDKAYVILNNYRHWIPDHATFNALGYDWSKIQSLSDNVLIAIPEAGRFPSVVR